MKFSDIDYYRLLLYRALKNADRAGKDCQQWVGKGMIAGASGNVKMRLLRSGEGRGEGYKSIICPPALCES